VIDDVTLTSAKGGITENFLKQGKRGGHDGRRVVRGGF
jgi:hypothetical protein